MKKTVFNLLFLLLGASLYAQQGFDKFTAKNPDKTFIGAIMQAESINEDTHRFIDVALNPITISFRQPIKSQTITPSYSEMIKVVEGLFKDGKIAMQNVNFSHAIREIKAYNELNALFGQKINPALLFDVPTDKASKQNLLVVSLEQKLLSIHMDLSDTPVLQGKKPEYDTDKLIYLNSVTFGRKAVALIESEQPLSKLKAAIDDVMQNYNNPEKIADTSHAILSNSNIRVMIVGGKAQMNVQGGNALTELLTYFNQKITGSDFISPIIFTAAWVKDNSVFENKYLSVHHEP